MRFLRSLRFRIRCLFHRTETDAALTDELQDYVERQTRRYLDRGLSPEEAHTAVLRDVGGLEQAKEACRDARGLNFIDNLARDLRFVLRSLMRTPVVITAAVVSLSLGMGAATALFTITNQALLQVLPVKNPQQLVLFHWKGKFIGGSTHGFRESFSYPAYIDLERGKLGVFSGIAAVFEQPADIADSGLAQRGVAELVSGNYFDVLGVTPALGRLLTPDDDRMKNAEPYVVISYEYWQRRFGGSPSILNRVIDINSHPVTVVGVAQRGFIGFNPISPADVFVPMMMKTAITPTWDDLARRSSIWLRIFGRLKPGVTAKHAVNAMALVYRQVLENDLSENNKSTEFQRRYLKNNLTFIDAEKGEGNLQNEFAKPLYVLWALVGILLLIACVNVANLLITRAAMRQREIAVRLSLGATRASLVRLILVESLLIAADSAALGLVLAKWVAGILVAFLPFGNIAIAIHTDPDLRVLAFAALLTIGTALFFGLAPALQSTRPDLISTLKSENAWASLATGQARLRRLLVAGQVSLSLILLFGSGLFVRSLHNLMAVDTGMNTSHVLQFSIDPSRHNYTPERARALFTDLQQRIGGLPGVISVSAAAVPLLADEDSQNTVHVQGYERQGEEDMNPGFNLMSPGFFTTMGVPLIAGRDFSYADRLGGPLVAIVNETFVRRFVPRGSPIGLHFGWMGSGPMPYEIVGVVKDMKGSNLKEEPKPWTYLPELQNEKPASMTYYVRTSGDLKSMKRTIVKTVQRFDSTLPVFDMRTLEDQIDRTQFMDRLFSWLAGAFGILATLLASVGLYGVTSYSVARRRYEIGIRIALGAQQQTIFSIVMREVLTLCGIGLLVGLPFTFWLGRLVSHQIFGTKPDDPWVIAAALMTIVIASAAAASLPAVRATRVDPIQTLKYE